MHSQQKALLHDTILAKMQYTYLQNNLTDNEIFITYQNYNKSCSLCFQFIYVTRQVSKFNRINCKIKSTVHIINISILNILITTSSYNQYLHTKHPDHNIIK